MSDESKVIGFEHLEKVLEHPTWVTEPLAGFFDKWRYFVQRSTVRKFKRGPGGWINKAEDRRSITSERDMAIFPQWARAGSNSKTFRFGEFGTGLLSEDPKSSRRRHWPPAAPLDPWAKRKKIPRRDNPEKFLTGKDIAAIIGLRGGLEPRRYLRSSRDEAQQKIPGWLNQMASAVERAAAAEGAKGLGTG